MCPVVAHAPEVGGAPTYANSLVTKKFCPNLLQTKVPFGGSVVRWSRLLFVCKSLGQAGGPLGLLRLETQGTIIKP